MDKKEASAYVVLFAADLDGFAVLLRKAAGATNEAKGCKMATRERLHESPEELLHHDHYDPDELARLLDMDRYLIRHAVFKGHLKAYKVGHEIISIRREDVLQWLRDRDAGMRP